MKKKVSFNEEISIVKPPESLTPEEDLSDEVLVKSLNGLDTETQSIQERCRCYWASVFHAIAVFFGLSDELDLLLWDESFQNRVTAGDVGLSFYYALPLPQPKMWSPVTPTSSPQLQMRDLDENQDKEASSSQKMPGPFDLRQMYGMDARNHYRRLEQAENLVSTTNTISEMRPKEIAILYRDIRKKSVAMGAVRKNLQVLHRLTPLPHHRPVFILTMTAVQFFVLVTTIMCGGFARASSLPVSQVMEAAQGISPRMMKVKWDIPNVWMGPPMAKLVRYGAFFGPCIRFDLLVKREMIQVNLTDQIGCCDYPDEATLTTLAECKELSSGTGNWTSGLCKGVKNESIPSPCCLGLLGKCKLTTKEHCDFANGFFHTEVDSCDKLNCLYQSCTSYDMHVSVKTRLEQRTVRQWWRIPISVIYNWGILQFMLITLMQWLLNRPIEVTAGWFRCTIIYLVAGIGGNLTGTIFQPYSLQLGGNGAVAGLCGIAFVEVVQSRRSVRHRVKQGLMLVGLFSVLLLCGLLPFFDNYTHVGGLICGILIGLLVLPHLGKRVPNIRCRFILCTFSIILLITYFVTFMLLFYKMEGKILCRGCLNFSCYRPVNGLCHMSSILRFSF